MTLKIIHKNNTSAGTPPEAGDLDVGEIAINAADAILYIKDVNGDIQEVKSNFKRPESGATKRTVDSKLQDVVSVKDFGATGNGTDSDRNAFQAALDTGKSVYVPCGTYVIDSNIAFTANGQVLYGEGNQSIVKTTQPFTSKITIDGLDGTAIRNLKIDAFDANTNPGIHVYGGSSGFDVENVYFYGGDQRVFLGVCDHIRVAGCTFDTTRYGVIQEGQTASSFGIVSNCIARNVLADFVELNCNLNETEVPLIPAARNWIIADNQFSSSEGYPTPGIEDRFVGITEVENVTITGNVVERSQGDAPIHLEDLRGETIISNNIISNCIPTGDNTGLVFILNSAENCIVDGNIFAITDPELNGRTISAYSSNSSPFSNKTVFSNNRVFSANGNTLRGLAIADQSLNSSTLITGNIFDNCTTVLVPNGTSNFTFSGNKLINCQALINADGPSLGGGKNNLISHNTTVGTTGTHDIYYDAGSNSKGLSNWKVSNNQFCKDVYFAGTGTAGGFGELKNLFVSDNQFIDDANLTIIGTLANCISTGNQYVHPATNDLKASTQTDLAFVNGFLNINGMQSASTSIAGSFDIDIDGIAGASATSSPLSVLLIYSGVSPNAANASKNIAWITTRMTTTPTGTTAAGLDIADIVGTGSNDISVTSNSASHMKISVTAAAEDALQRVAVFLIGATERQPYKTDLTTFTFSQT